MSQDVFPYWLIGQRLTVAKSPLWSAGVTRAVSGIATGINKQAWPRRKYTLGWDWLNDAWSRSNLLPYSSDFTQWIASQGGAGIQPIVVPNQGIAPDGTLTADQILLATAGTTSSDYSRLVKSVTVQPNSTYTFSVWVMTPDGSTPVVEFADTSFNAWLVYQQVSGAWTRYVVTGTTLAGQTNVNVNILISGIAQFTQKAVNLLVWGAQLEPGSAASPYIPTYGTAYSGTDVKQLAGLIDAMRGQFDTFLYQDPDWNTVQGQTFGGGGGGATSWQLLAQYSNDGLALGAYGSPDIVENKNGAPQIFVTRYGLPELMSAASRTNLALQSSNFATTWGASNITVTVNAYTAPDGTLTADALLEAATNTTHPVSQSGITVPAATGDFTFSLFFKPNLTRTFAALTIQETLGNTQLSQVFNLGTGALGVTTSVGTNWANLRASITPAAQGFYRCTVTGTKLNAATGMIVSLRPLSGDNLNSYLGVVTDGVTVWGAQFEAGSLPTAYVPTTTATVAQTDYTLSSTNLVTQSGLVVPTGANLTWSGSFFFRCRFQQDDPGDFGKLFQQAWELKKLEFASEVT